MEAFIAELLKQGGAYVLAGFAIFILNIRQSELKSLTERVLTALEKNSATNAELAGAIKSMGELLAQQAKDLSDHRVREEALLAKRRQKSD